MLGVPPQTAFASHPPLFVRQWVEPVVPVVPVLPVLPVLPVVPVVLLEPVGPVVPGATSRQKPDRHMSGSMHAWLVQHGLSFAPQEIVSNGVPCCAHMPAVHEEDHKH